MTAQKIPCPACGSARTIPIAFGLPGRDLVEAARRGEVVLGGCVVSDDNPVCVCRDCGYGEGSGISQVEFRLLSGDGAPRKHLVRPARTDNEPLSDREIDDLAETMFRLLTDDADDAADSRPSSPPPSSE